MKSIYFYPAYEMKMKSGVLIVQWMVWNEVQAGQYIFSQYRKS